MFACSHRPRPRIIACNFYAASDMLQSLNIKARVGNATSCQEERGSKWNLWREAIGGKVGNCISLSTLQMLPAVTKRIKQVITGWPQLSAVYSPTTLAGAWKGREGSAGCQQSHMGASRGKRQGVGEKEQDSTEGLTAGRAGGQLRPSLHPGHRNRGCCSTSREPC